MDDLTLEEIAALRDLGSTAYVEQVISLFASGRATQQEWLTLGVAIQHLSESATGILVAAIDRAILRHLVATKQADMVQAQIDAWGRRPVG